MLKEFGPEWMKVRENVAGTPSLGRYRGALAPGVADYFCLRMDADEYTQQSFSEYYGFFKKHKAAITVFFNVNSFKDARNEIIRCRDIGVDIQSHAFYHYTYNDYVSNRYNIKRAKDFFLEMGMDTIGFAAPMGKWNASLMKALESEWYKYSSDFSYDHTGFPSYPVINGRKSPVLEIPIFPVAPELFFQNGPVDAEKVAEYFKRAIDELMRCELPVILYGHTDPKMPQIPYVLEEIASYAVNVKKLRPLSMTDIYKEWSAKAEAFSRTSSTAVTEKIPADGFIARSVELHPADRFKNWLKDTLDFERMTPPEDLKCNPIKKTAKLLARKIL